jgi:hypothetical protein
MSTSRNILDSGARAARIRTILLLVFAAIPLTFPPFGFLGFNLSGWTWLMELAIIAPIVLSEPIHRQAARYLMPYQLFGLYSVASLAWSPNFRQGVQLLAQLTVPALAYLLAWRASEDLEIRRKLIVISRWGLGIATVLFVGGLVMPGSFGFGPVSRPASLSLVALFVVATLDSKSWRSTILIGGVALTLTVAAGARAASAILIIMLLISPSLGLDWRGRAVIISICLVAVVMGVNTQAFKQRFFFNQKDASLEAALTMSGNVNTAGRRELWPSLVQECSSAQLTGLGIGSASALSSSLSEGAINQPHNDYLRIYCDVGLFGTATFWTFFLWTGLRSWRRALIGPDPSLHGAAGQLVLALLLFAITDNALSYTALFMVPLGVVLGLSDRALMKSRMRPGNSYPQDKAAYP